MVSERGCEGERVIVPQCRVVFEIAFFLSPRLYPLLFCSFVLSLYAPLTLVVAQAPFFLLSARTSHIYVTSYAMSFFFADYSRLLISPL